MGVMASGSAATVPVIGLRQLYYGAVAAGRKTVEGRKNTPRWAALCAGALVRVVCDEADCPSAGQSFLARVVSVATYMPDAAEVAAVEKGHHRASAEAVLRRYLAAETLAATLPGVMTLEGGVAAYLSLWGAEEVARFGVRALRLARLDAAAVREPLA